MKTINKIILIGYIGSIPIINKKKILSIIKFSLSTLENKKTTWHNITLFLKNSKINKIIKKGSLIYLEGKIYYNNWNNKLKTEIICNMIKILNIKKKIKIIFKKNFLYPL